MLAWEKFKEASCSKESEEKKSILIVPTKESFKKVKNDDFKEIILDRGEVTVTNIPEELLCLRTVQKLVIQNHTITCIPQSIINIQNLIDLRLNNNKITLFPVHLQGTWGNSIG